MTISVIKKDKKLFSVWKSGKKSALFYFFHLQEYKPKSYETVAVLCAFCGIFLIATHGQLNSLAVSKESLIWGLSSAVCFTIYCLYPQKLYDDFGLINVIGWGSVLSSILLAVTTGTYRLPEVPANCCDYRFSFSICSIWNRNQNTWQCKSKSVRDS